jgi:hypothetical protein
MTRPPTNPDVDDIADRAKHADAAGTQLLAEVSFRLAELAGTGALDPDESMCLQSVLQAIGQELYYGTLCAVRDGGTPDHTWSETDNTYSDGRQVITRTTTESESVDASWPHNRFLLGTLATDEFPLSAICYIAPIKDPTDDRAPRQCDADRLAHLRGR